jgi:hypothetical protein
MSEYTDYLLEEIVANIRMEYTILKDTSVTEESYMISRLKEVAEVVTKMKLSDIESFNNHTHKLVTVVSGYGEIEVCQTSETNPPTKESI